MWYNRRMKAVESRLAMEGCVCNRFTVGQTLDGFCIPEFVGYPRAMLDSRKDRGIA